MRIGIFGGTFNPIHLAHLIVAESLREEMRLDRVLFVPSALPPHKEAPEAGAAHRLAMTRLAVSANPFFESGDIEVARGGRSYSVDTLRELNRAHPGDDFFFVIGRDAFAEIRTWREAEALFGLTNFLVIPRPGHPLAHPGPCLPRGVVLGDGAGEESGDRVRRFRVEGGKDICLVEIPVLDISASDIRRRIREGRSVRYLVPEAVEAYIRREGLY